MHKVIHTNIYKIGEYSQHLKKLSDQDRVSRFGHLVKNESIDQLILNMVYNYRDHELWYVMIDDIRVGWGHMAKDGNGSFEMALSVDHDYQGRGIADALISEMINWAKFHQVEKFYMHCIEENRIVQHLAHKHGLVTQSRGGGERTALLEVPNPSLLETSEQIFKESTEIFIDFLKLQKRVKYFWILPILPKDN